MKLHWSPRSPFVRKVMIVLHETGLLEKVTLERNVVAMVQPPDPAVLADNPLGKIPVLVTDDGLALYDSRVICEYLDQQAGTDLYPQDPAARFRALRWQALADGLTDILLLWRTELTRDAGPWRAVTDGLDVKVRTTIRQFDREAGELAAAPFGIGHVALAAALGQLDFRWQGSGWRERFTELAGLAVTLEARPSSIATLVRDDDAGPALPHPLDFTKE